MSAGLGVPEELASLKRQLDEATDTLRAIRQGEVDAVVVDGPAGNQIYTLQTADHPYRVLVEQMNEGALVLSREGFILHANPRFSGLVMALPADLGAGPVQDWIAPEDRRQFESALELAFDGKTQRLDLSLLPRHLDSSPVPVVVSLAPLNLQSVNGVCAVITDLRERRQRERLERGESMARSLMDHATAAVIITDSEGRIERANAAALALAGVPMVSKPLDEVFPLEFDKPTSDGEPALTLIDLVHMATAAGNSRSLQARMQASSGNTIELQVSAGPFAPSPNEVTGAVFTLADVTALKSSEQRFRALAESIPQIVWTADSTGRLDYCNSVGTEYFGMTVAQVADTNDRIMHPEDIPIVENEWRLALETATPLQVECRLKNRAGEFHWFLVRAVPVSDRNGRITQWFGTSTDVDLQKRTENDLRRANADLEHFAYAASHDFQEPLRMITAYAQLLEKDFGGQLEGSGDIALRYVLEGTDRLGALLQNLLLYIGASRDPEQAAEQIDCDQVLREVVSNLQLSIQQSGARIHSSGLPRLVYPRIHMLELLQNLVNNAIKYRREDPPEIDVSAARNGREWIFSIRDNGMGIAPQHLQNIFGVFKRLHGNSIPGTGIGLAICRRIVEQHRGRIWAESQVDRGSIFYLSLPIAAIEQNNDTAHA